MIVNMLIFISTDPWYMEVGELIVDSLNLYTRVEGGFASIRDVTSMELEDHQHSFFLSFFFFFIIKLRFLSGQDPLPEVMILHLMQYFMFKTVNVFC